MARIVRTSKERPEVVVAQRFERPQRRSMVLAQARRCLPIAAVWQLPQPQAVHRHDRCGPGRGKVWKPAASKCFAAPHLGCSGIGIPGSVPRNGAEDGPSWASKTQKGRALLLGPPQNRAPRWPTTKNGSPWIQRA